MKKIYLFTIISLKTLFASAQLYTPGGGVTDIDGNTYQTIVINGQEWMAENLRTSKYANGNLIPNISVPFQMQLQVSGAWSSCYTDSLHETIYGKHYNWYAVIDPRNVCPTGWHTPSDAEWAILINFLEPWAGGGTNPNSAGLKMKTPGNADSGTGLWAWPNTGSNNESGFTGLPGGQWNANIGSSGFWWSKTESSIIDSTEAWCINLDNDFADVKKRHYPKFDGESIRCIKDNSSSIPEINQTIKSLIKVFDTQGKETDIKPNELLFFLFNDGSVEKKIIFE
jgi:uncharacterized protein (TIGR02145 family)